MSGGCTSDGVAELLALVSHPFLEHAQAIFSGPENLAQDCLPPILDSEVYLPEA